MPARVDYCTRLNSRFSERLREERNPSAAGWSDWKKALVPLRSGREHRGNPDQVGLICSSIRSDFTDVDESCGIYEWRAKGTSDDQPTHVVYIGSTCRCKTGSLEHRILEYCRNGSHKKDLFNDALLKGYELWVRVRVVEKDYPDGKKDAEDLENEFLARYDYAWNKRRNGNCTREILP